MAESLELLNQVSRRAEQDGVVLRTGFSTCFHCPFEGRISSRSLLNAVRAAREQGPWRVALCDTDGMAFPDQVSQAPALIHEELEIPPTDMALHFHDTYGRALANTLADLEAAVRGFECHNASPQC